MELSNILKTFINHLKNHFIIFIGVWFVIGLFLFLPITRSDNFFGIIYLVYLLSSLIFAFVLGTVAFGSYTKTFILVQNNRKKIVLACLIFSLLVTSVFTIIAAFLRLKAKTYNITPFNFPLALCLIAGYLLFFYLGAMYGLFIKFNKKAKRIFYIVMFTLFSIFGIIILPLGVEIVNVIVYTKYFEDVIIVFYMFSGLNIILIPICILKTLKLDILKSYSFE
jgi:MFS family permease